MFGKNKQHLELVTAMDIGSSAIRMAVGQRLSESGKPRDLQVLGVVDVPSLGVHKGVVTSIEDAISSIADAEERLERLIGIPVESAWVGITDPQIVVQASKGVVAVAKTDGEISAEDVERAVDAARMVAAPLNYDILHVLPRTFAVDGQMGINDPVGMSGIRLEVDTQIIYGLTSHLKNMSKAVYRTGIDIEDMVLSIFATAEVVTTPRQRDLGVCVVNIGGSTTSIAVYEEGDVIHTAILPLGSEHITNDLAIGMRTSIDIAERTKITYGQCTKQGVTKKEVIDLASAGAPTEELVFREYMIDIIGARIAEILEKVDGELRRIDRSRRLPAGVVLTGGGAKLRGLIEFTKEQLQLPASLGYPVDVQSASEKSGDLACAPVIGILQWATRMRTSHERGGKGGGMNVGKVVDRFQNILKSLMP